MMLSGLARHQARGVGEKDNGGRGGGVELARVKWRRRLGLAQRPTFCQPGWVAPRAASFPLFGCCPVSRPAGRLGLEMACLRPAIVAVAGKSTFCELRANCSDWLFATCIAREVPEVPAGGSQRLALIHIQRLLLLLLADELVDQVHGG